tara:strand:+ start:14920 stop:15336 length:417 start_codon:yes stop_codon:yes gene_type:complete
MKKKKTKVKTEKGYKEYKENFEEKSKGAGDTVAKITKATGIDKAVKFLAGEDCGCDERKDKLNNIFPYYRPNCLTEDEYNYIGEQIKTATTRIERDDVPKLLKIYNRVFNDNKAATACDQCFVNGVWAKLKTVYNQYN